MSSQPGFRVSWRGYDRLQVDNYRSRVETELASAHSAHHRAVHAHAQTTERLRAAHSDLGRLRGQLTNSPTALSDRLREILQLAAQEAEQTRADAQTEADQIRSRAGTDAETIVQHARDTAAGILDGARAEQQKRQADIEDAQAAAGQQLDDARAEAIRVRDTSQTELDQLAAEAQQARDRADAEAAARRSDADRHAREQRERAHAAAASRLTDMTQQLTDLTRHRDDILATLRHLHQELANTPGDHHRSRKPTTDRSPGAGGNPRASPRTSLTCRAHGPRSALAATGRQAARRYSWVRPSSTSVRGTAGLKPGRSALFWSNQVGRHLHRAGTQPRCRRFLTSSPRSPA